MAGDGTDSRQVVVSAEIDSTASFCMQQNYIDLAKTVTTENRTEAPLRDLVVRVTSDPEFVIAWEGHVAAVGAGRRYTMDQVDVCLSPNYLVGLTERTRGLLRISVWDASGELASTTKRVDVLAYDQWAGIRTLPELIAAFVLPNHPTIERLLAGARELLRTSGKSDALDGYQRETRSAVLEITGAIYETLRRQRIGYLKDPLVLLPVSYAQVIEFAVESTKFSFAGILV